MDTRASEGTRGERRGEDHLYREEGVDANERRRKMSAASHKDMLNRATEKEPSLNGEKQWDEADKHKTGGKVKHRLG